MKKFLITICILFIYSVSNAADLTFSWLPDATGNTTGYKIHFGKESKKYTQFVDVGMPTVVDGRLNGKVPVSMVTIGEPWFYAATGYNLGGSSDFSNEVPYTIPFTTPVVPGDFQAVVTINVSASKVKINLEENPPVEPQQ